MKIVSTEAVLASIQKLPIAKKNMKKNKNAQQTKTKNTFFNLK